MFDIRSLFVVMVVTNLVLAASLWVGTGRRLQDGLGPWTLSLLVQALALVLFAGRGTIPDWASTVVAKEAFVVDGAVIPLTTSAGVAARIDEGPEGLDQIIARADEALYIAESRGRNRVAAVSLGRSRAA